ncbi:DUF308 domain-containing protein [Yoonia sp.]|uniref:HdeD family acid-resistance protein n=1 Tax=Yoonia sp. TaxID=2212373 RepID=UPI0025CED122|nr:DUF308 domain-containing protein [Yoonia sp.]
MASYDIREPHEAALRGLQVRLWISGLSAIILGGTAVVFPFAATMAAELFLGAILAVSGGIQIVRALASRGDVNTLWTLLFGVVALGAGGFLLFYPPQGILTLTIILAGFFLIGGVMKMISAWYMRPASLSATGLPVVNGWGWLALSGILGVALFWGLPITAVWALGLLMGIDLIFLVGAEIAFAIAPRRVNHAR